MDFGEYAQRAVSTAIYPGQGTFMGLNYCVLKMNGEAGEAAEAVGKAMRDDQFKITDERREKLLLELGDVLWYVTNAAKELGTTLEDVAFRNVNKLADRKARDKLHGSGDTR